MFGKINTELGTINISNEVISRIAANVTGDCYGVVGMAYRSKADGLSSILRGETVSKGANITFSEDDIIDVELHIVTQYGVNITAISESIIKNVKYQIKNMTGFEVNNVNVFVESIRVNDN